MHYWQGAHLRRRFGLLEGFFRIVRDQLLSRPKHRSMKGVLIAKTALHGKNPSKSLGAEKHLSGAEVDEVWFAHSIAGEWAGPNYIRGA